MTLKNGCAASSPVTSRAAVPLLPASSTWAGSTRPSLPRPRTSKQPLRSSTSTPRPRIQPSIEARSSPSQRFDTRAVPLAIELSRIARCEIDLSPGSSTAPASRRAALTVCFMGRSGGRIHCSSSVPITALRFGFSGESGIRESTESKSLITDRNLRLVSGQHSSSISQRRPTSLSASR